MRGSVWCNGICLAFVLGLMMATSAFGAELRDPLTEVLANADADELVPISIVLTEQLPRETVERLAVTDNARKKIAVRLRSLARRTQAQLLVDFRELEGLGKVQRIRPLWISNVIGIDATPAVIRELAKRPEIAWMNHNPKRAVFLERPAPNSTRADLHQGQSEFDGRPPFESFADETDWGVELMRAPEVWNDLGITGAGARIAVIDSGVCYMHSDIVNQIWVNPGEDLDGDGAVMDSDDLNGVDDDGNGFVDDLIGWDFDTGDNDPNDDSSGHGSHVAGTVAGDGTDGHLSGMAPDAKVMVVRVGLDLSDEVDVWNGMQYAADNYAHAISMSLGWRHQWDPDRATWRQNSDNVIAMGTAMIVAAGNEGQGDEPDNVRTPGDVPNVISIGSTAQGDVASGFSSRGPVTWESVSPYNDHPYPPGMIKPDISAPGSNTRSHNFCTGYSNKSGTSMATPHVAGAAALMLEGDPFLTPAELRQILEETSVDLGDPEKDNTFGWGRVDAFEATSEANRMVRYVTHSLDDSGDDRGNADGELDPLEVAELSVTLTNVDVVETATGVVAYLVSETPGLIVLDNRVDYPDLAPLDSSGPSGAPFTIKVETPCFTDATLRMDVYHNDGRRSRNRFVLRVGSPQFDVMFEDDMESVPGWTIAGTAADGHWELGVPQGTTGSSGDANPPNDASSDGSKAYVTGNNGLNATDDDVDGGETFVTSPTIDGSEFANASVTYFRWFYRDGFAGIPPTETFVVEASDDNGQSWVELEVLLNGENEWIGISEDLGAVVELTEELVFRVRVADEGSGTDSVVEGGLDEVLITGDRIVCDDYDPPEYDLPPSVGNTLLVDAVGSHVRLTWSEPVPGAGEGPVNRYAIDRGDDPSQPLAQVGGATRTEWFDVGELDEDTTLRSYLVYAENGGGRSDEMTP